MANCDSTFTTTGAVMSMMRTLKRLLRDTRGATVVEYAVLCAMIFFAIMTAVSGFANQTNLMWTRVNTTLQNANA